MEERLSQRVVKSGLWAFALRAVNRAFRFIRLIILARVLAPEDFGLMGIALLTMATLDTFSQTGFQAALIQKKDDIKSYLDAAWTVLILRGSILFAILYIIAPFAAHFFNAQEAEVIIRVIGLSFLIQAFTNIGVIYFEKELEFNKLFIYSFVGTLSDFVVAVSAALILKNVWALVFGSLAGSTAMCITSYFIHPYKPKFDFHLGKAKELFGFGKWILGSSILVFLLTQGDDIFVGKLLGATALGLYQLAYRISNMPATEITHVISQVTFPAYSKLQDNIEKLRETYLRVLQSTAFLSFPIAGLIFVLAPDFTRIFLGEKWMPMVPAMFVLACWGAIRSLVGAISPVFMSLGKPEIVTKMQFFQTVLLFILIYPLTIRWNILGTSAAVFLSALAMFFVRYHILIKTFGPKIWIFYKPIFIPLIFTLINVSLLIFLKMLIGYINIYSFSSLIVIFILLFVFLTYIADRFLNYKMKTLIKENIRSIVKPKGMSVKKSNVMRTRELDLCVSCEICSATCPRNAIRMDYKFGQFLPIVEDKNCTNCGLCLDICPGIDIDPLKLRYKKFSNDVFDGHYLESYTAYSNDPDIRKNSASGGLITNLIIELIKNKEFDVAFVLDFDRFNGKPARLKATNDINEILNAAKSKYIPASVYNIIKVLRKKDDRRFIIVGTPCQIHGIKKFIKRFNISEENLLFLGLFCEKTLNFNIIRYFEDIYGKSNEKLIKFEFRTKEKYGWPGNTKLYFDSGREIIIDKRVRMQLKKFFQLNRCLFCVDKLNRLADISFGDCYIEGKGGFYGKSNVIIRTKKGKDIFSKYSYLFTMERESIEKIKESQHLTDKEDNLEFAKVFIKKNNIYPNTIPDYKINNHAAKKLSILQRYIKWGKNHNIYKIRCFLFLSKVINRARNIMKRATKVGIIFVEGLFIYWCGRKRSILKEKTTGNVVIIGGELFNKGAQAMTFTVVDQIRRRFPHKNIYLFSAQDFDRKEEEKKLYKFNILPWDFTTKIRLLCPWNKLLFKRSRYNYLEEDIKQIIENTDFFIDVSGYALSSQWGGFSSINYLLNIIIAKKYSIPYYILPQSIGPFDYPLRYKIFLYPLMNLYLKYPERIFPREKEGLICVHKFTKKNVEKNHDIVLQNKGYDLDNIYTKKDFKDIKVEPNSVGIIPNLRVIERANPDEIFSVYKVLIRRLIDAKKVIYILRHSYEDLDICEKIMDFFSNTKSIKLISDDLNTIELENIIKNFDFVIASRYHSIILSYKNGVPALVIGWATKYSELLKNFDQMDYLFDVRNKIDIEEIKSKLEKLIQNYNHERVKIINKMIEISNKENIFDGLFKSTKRQDRERK